MLAPLLVLAAAGVLLAVDTMQSPSPSGSGAIDPLLSAAQEYASTLGVTRPLQPCYGPSGAPSCYSVTHGLAVFHGPEPRPDLELAKQIAAKWGVQAAGCSGQGTAPTYHVTFSRDGTEHFLCNLRPKGGSRARDMTRAEDELFALLRKQGGNFDHVEYRDGAFIVYYGGCMLTPLPSWVPTTWRGHPVQAGACGITACPPHRHHQWRSGSRIVSPYSQIVTEVKAELDRKLGGGYSFRQYANPDGSGAITELGAPAPSTHIVSAAVRAAMARHKRDSHTLVREGYHTPCAVVTPTNPIPCATGAGWHLLLIETRGTNPPGVFHAH